jgi:hypothetical protein
MHQNRSEKPIERRFNMNPRVLLAAIALLATGVLAAGPVMAQTGVSPAEEDVPEGAKIYSPYVERTATDKDFAEGLYWGDTHLHTGTPRTLV